MTGMAELAGMARELADRLAPARRVILAVALFVLTANVVVVTTFEAEAGRAPGSMTIEEAVSATPLRSSTSTTVDAGETTTTAAPTTTDAPTTTAAPSTTEAPATSTTSAAAPATVGTAALPAAGPWSLEPYRGLGAWVDVYDWSVEFTGGAPTVSLAQIDEMAQRGVQTLYIQTGHRRSGADIMEHQRLLDLINRAHSHGMQVIGWYLPMLEDLETDFRRMIRPATRLPLDGFGVDIESLAVSDVAERNRRLLALSTRLRGAMGPGKVLSAITPSAVHVQVVNPGFWPDFPWAQLAGAYDVFQPMAYWSVRRAEWKDGERYIGENIDRIRIATGRPELPVHPVGGIADGASVPDVEGMLRASSSRGAIGLSLYDWRTSNPAQWAALAPIRR
jgi:hypothetical protein